MPKPPSKGPRSWRSTLERLVLAAFFAGAISCSWTTDFVVVNASQETVRVSYVFKPQPPDECCDSFPEPAVAKASELDQGPVWREVLLEEPRSPGRVAVLLAPGEALRIADLGSYSRPSLRDREEFPIEEIEIRNSRGALRLCGPAILLAFEGANRHRQELEFLGHPRQLHSGLCETPSSPPASTPKER